MGSPHLYFKIQDGEQRRIRNTIGTAFLLQLRLQQLLTFENRHRKGEFSAACLLSLSTLNYPLSFCNEVESYGGFLMHACVWPVAEALKQRPKYFTPYKYFAWKNSQWSGIITAYRVWWTHTWQSASEQTLPTADSSVPFRQPQKRHASELLVVGFPTSTERRNIQTALAFYGMLFA